MSSSDIYQSKERPVRPGQNPPVSQRRRHAPKSFDEAIENDLSKTHHRRRRNSGTRRFRHQMKKPGFSRKFWTIVLSVSGLILILLLLWDRFLRY